MPRNTKKKTQSVEREPDSDNGPTRMTTRPRNATAHPGNVVRENLRARRGKDEIQDEKDQKRARKEEKEKQKAQAEALKAQGRAIVAQLEAEDAAVAANAKQQIPRHRSKTDVSTKEIAVPKAVKRKVSVPVDTDPETSASPPPKRVKSSVGQVSHKPLRRTETMLQDKLLAESDDEDKQLIPSHDTDTEDDETTPRPAKKSQISNSDYSEQDEREDFQTPLTLKRSKIAKQSFIGSQDDSTLSELSDDEMDNGEWEKKKPVKGKKQTKVIAADTVATDSEFAADNHAKQAPDSGSRPKKIDFHLISRKTSTNAIVASRPASLNAASVAPKSGPSAASKSSRSAAPMSAANELASKPTNVDSARSVAPKSAVSEHSRKPTGKSATSGHSHKPTVTTGQSSASELAHQSAPPKPGSTKSSSAQIAMATAMDNGDEDFEPGPAVGGLLDEDDSLEREVAMSSPLKGTELQAAKKSIIKGQAPQDIGKHRKRATIQDLPEGANDEGAWTRLVVPNFIRLVMAGEQAWLIDDEIIISDLQVIWKHVYGQRVPFKIKRGTVPFDLAVQKLYDYRGKIAQKAICAVLSYIYDQRQDTDDPEMDGEEIERLAKGMLADHNSFLFKGMEDKHRPTKTGTFRHVLIIETLSTHYATFMQGQPLKSLDIGDPQLSIALAAAAIERALELFARGLIENHPDAKGRNKLSVRKVHHSNSGMMSSFSTEFSALEWNKATMEYFRSVKQLNAKKLAIILNEAKELVQKGSIGKEELVDSHSGRATLCSDEED